MLIETRLRKLESKLNLNLKGSDYIKLLNVASDEDLISYEPEYLLKKYAVDIKKYRMNDLSLTEASIRMIMLDILKKYDDKFSIIPFSEMMKYLSDKC